MLNIIEFNYKSLKETSENPECSPSSLKDQFDDAKVLIKETTKVFNKTIENCSEEERRQIKERFDSVVVSSFNQIRQIVTPIIEKVFCVSRSSLNDNTYSDKASQT